MKISTKIKLDMYQSVITFIVTDTISRISNQIHTKHKIPQDDDDGDAEGLLIEADISTYYLIIDKDFLTHNTIAHEVLHVVLRMTEARDIYEEESLAWIAGHVSGAIYKFLDKKSIKVRHE